MTLLTLNTLVIFTIIVLLIIIFWLPVKLYSKSNKRDRLKKLFWSLRYSEKDFDELGSKTIRNSKLVYLLLIGLLCFLAGFVIRDGYVYPADEAIFSNTDYHGLLHHGYRFSDSLQLVNDANPEHSLWDTDLGEISIYRADSGFHIQGYDYGTPFYYNDYKSNRYLLANSPVNLDLSDGFILKYDSLSLRLEVHESNDEDEFKKAVYIAHFNGVTDTLGFNKKLTRGYNDLLDILRTSDELRLPESWETFLDGTLLTRDEIPTRTEFEKDGQDLFYLEKEEYEKGNELSALRIFPSRYLQSLPLQYSDLRGNTGYFSIRTFNLTLESGCAFYAGVGNNTRTYYLFNKNTQAHILFDRPNAFSLPKHTSDTANLNRLFIESDFNSIPKIIDLNGGFYFDEFELENNIHHVSSTIVYRSESPRDVLMVGISDKNDESNQAAIISTDQNGQFEFKTANDEVNWLMELRNFREQNRLGVNTMVLPLVCFFGLLVLWTIWQFRSPELFHNHNSFYWVILCFVVPFFVIRTVLLWRLATFPLLESGTAYEYHNYLFNGKEYFEETWKFLLIFVILVMSGPLIGRIPTMCLKIINGLKVVLMDLESSKPVLWIKGKGQKPFQSIEKWLRQMVNPILRFDQYWSQSADFRDRFSMPTLTLLLISGLVLNLIPGEFISGIDMLLPFVYFTIFVLADFMIGRTIFLASVQEEGTSWQWYAQYDRGRKLAPVTWLIRLALTTVFLLSIHFNSQGDLKLLFSATCLIVWIFFWNKCGNLLLSNIYWKAQGRKRGASSIDRVMFCFFLIAFVASMSDFGRIFFFWIFYFTGLHLTSRLEMPRLESTNSITKDIWTYGARNSRLGKLTPIISPVLTRVALNFLKICLTLIFLLLVAMKDAGYLMIAVSFVLIFWGWSYAQIKPEKLSGTKGLRNKIVLFLLIGASFFLILRYQHLLVLLTWDAIYDYGLILFIGILFSMTWLFFISLGRGNTEILRGSYQKLIGGSVVIFIAVAFVLYNTSLKEKVVTIMDDNVHVKYRSLYFSGVSHDELIQQVKINSYGMLQLRRITHSASMIHYYGDNFDSNGRYFQPQSHDDYGATFNTQTTDLVTARFILGEHGSTLMVCIGCLLYVVTLYGLIRAPSPTRNRSGWLIGYAPCVVLLISYLIIFLVNTNRIPFVGQDILFISLFSRVSVILPLIILGLMLIFESCWKMEEKNEVGMKTAKETENGLGALFILFVSIAAIALFLIKPKDPSNENIQLSNSIERLAKNIRKFNRKFEQHQRDEYLLEGGKYFTKEPDTLTADSVFNNFMLLDELENNGTVSQIFEFSENPAGGVEDLRTPFNSSAFALFKARQDLQNSDNLLHLIRRNGIFKLRLNRQYFFVPVPEFTNRPRWTGNVLAENFRGRPEFDLVHYNRDQVIPATGQYFEDNMLTNARGANRVPNAENIRIHKLPANWLKGEDDQLFIDVPNLGHTSSDQASFRVYDPVENKLYSSSSSEKGSDPYATELLSFKIKKEDIVSIVAPNNTVTELGIEPSHNSQYLLRQFWINGRNRKFYPLADKFGWVYHYGNLVDEKFSSQAEDHNKDLVLSLDYGLIESLYTSFESASSGNRDVEISGNERRELIRFHRNLVGDGGRKSVFHQDPVTKEVLYANDSTALTITINEQKKSEPLIKVIENLLIGSFDFNLSVIDGDGKIRAIYDYSKTYKVDPNDIDYYQSYLAGLYRDSNFEDERNFLGNKNLLIINKGVGSSIKPLMYAALTSQFKSPDWSWSDVRWNQVSEPMRLYNNPSQTYVRYWGGYSFRNARINYSTSPRVSGDDYLISSNNMTHSIMMFLGSHKRTQLLNLDNLLELKTDYMNEVERFPVIRINNRDWVIRRNWLDENRRVPSDHSIQGKSILADGLEKNFDVETVGGNSQRISIENLGDNEFHAFHSGDSLINGSFYWAYPEGADFWMEERNDFRFAINNSTLGGYPIRMTSLKMAEMGLRLFKGKKADEPLYSILADNEVFDRPGIEDFDSDPGWSVNEFQGHLDQIKDQMIEVLERGTATGLNRKIQEIPGSDRFTFYAKTGTSSGASAELRNKYLLFVIENNDERDKVFVGHMVFHGIALNRLDGDFLNGEYEKIFRIIMASDSFKSYFNVN